VIVILNLCQAPWDSLRGSHSSTTLMFDHLCDHGIPASTLRAFTHRPRRFSSALLTDVFNFALGHELSKMLLSMDYTGGMRLDKGVAT
jgi:hypothetical protein